MEKYQRRLLTFACTAVYFASYLTRYGISVSLAEMVSSGSFEQSVLSAAVGGLFIVYGVGQIVSGWLGDRINPTAMIFAGLFVSSLINIAVPFCGGTALIVLWCVNGFCQALIWPPMVRILTAYLDPRSYERACIAVFWGSSGATILLYLISPLYISLSGWRPIFYLTFTIGILCSLLWLGCMRRLDGVPLREAEINGGEQTAKAKPGKIGIAAIGIIMLVIVAMGMLRDGITTWMPVYIMETFEFSGSASILTGVALPIFGVICYRITTKLYDKRFSNEMTCSSVLFLLGLVSLAALCLLFDKSALFSALLLAAAVGSMHGANFMLTAIIPARFAKFGGVSFISGLLNFCTYVGAAVSTYGVSLISETGGWRLTIILWTAVCAVGTLLGFFAATLWKKLMKGKTS